jgi:hypothetical protein
MNAQRAAHVGTQLGCEWLHRGVRSRAHSLHECPYQRAKGGKKTAAADFPRSGNRRCVERVTAGMTFCGRLHHAAGERPAGARAAARGRLIGEPVEISSCSVHGSTGPPRTEIYKHLEPLALPARLWWEPVEGRMVRFFDILRPWAHPAAGTIRQRPSERYSPTPSRCVSGGGSGRCAIVEVQEAQPREEANGHQASRSRRRVG